MKVIAIKLKKKVHEQNLQIEELKSNNGGVAQMTANFANLQLEYDKAQDTVEIQKKENNELTKDLKNSIENLNEIKLKNVELVEEIEKLKKYENDSKILAKEKDEILEKFKDYEEIRNHNEKLKMDLENAKSDLENQKQKHKKQDLLDLELEEAESRISTLTR